MKKNTRKILNIIIALALVLSLAACSTGTTNKETPATDTLDGGQKYVIGFSNCSMAHSWRTAFVDTMLYEVEKNSDIIEDFIQLDADGDINKQLADCEDLLNQDIDILLLSPQTSDALAPVGKMCAERNIPLIVVDRSISSEDYTSAVISDGVKMGAVIAEYAAKKYDGKFNWINLEGTPGAGPNEERNKGLDSVFANYPDIKLLSKQPCNWSEAEGLEVMENLLQAYPDIDVVIPSNGDIALGAYKAIKAAGRENEIEIISIDCSRNDCLTAMKDGKITMYTATNPVYQGGLAIRVCLEILKGGSVDKQISVPPPIVTEDNFDQWYFPNDEPGDYSYWKTVYTDDLAKEILGF